MFYCTVKILIISVMHIPIVAIAIDYIIRIHRQPLYKKLRKGRRTYTIYHILWRENLIFCGVKLKADIFYCVLAWPWCYPYNLIARKRGYCPTAPCTSSLHWIFQRVNGHSLKKYKLSYMLWPADLNYIQTVWGSGWFRLIVEHKWSCPYRVVQRIWKRR